MPPALVGWGLFRRYADRMTCTCGNALPHRNTIEEALAILKVSKPTLYRRIAQGLLKVTKDGARTFISGAELVRYLSEGGP